MRLLLIITFSLYYLLQAQNLVPNPGFEEFEKCPNTYTQFARKKLIPHWNLPTKGTSDYFNKCHRNRRVGVPVNQCGIQPAHSGDAYAGIYIASVLLNNEQRNYREYLQSELTKKLIKDSLYCVKSYVSLANYSEYTSNSYGMYLSKKKIKNRKKSEHLPYVPQISYPDTLFVFSSEEWIQVCGIYKALGDEKYITLGNFNDEKHTLVEKADLSNIKKRFIDYGHSYLFVDDVSVELIHEESECLCLDYIMPVKRKVADLNVNSSDFVVERKLVIEDVAFDHDKYDLKPDAFGSLEPLIEYLHKNSDVEIQINGYTDSIGTEAYNLELSERRARSVAEHLIKKGISPERINYIGYGKADLIADNRTEEGRAKNRRVEIILHE